MDTLVSYEVARLAKVKGYESTYSHYYILPYQNFKPDFVARKWTGFSEHLLPAYKIGKTQPHLCGAPTQVSLQKWLRDTHKLDITITPNGLGNYYYTLLYNSNYTDSPRIWDSYEECLEEGLLKALHLLNKEI